jgi:excisionase family DNA binding protein
MTISTLPFLTLSQACEILGYSKHYLYQLTSKRVIPYYKARGGKILFDKNEIEAWIRRGKIATADELEAQADAVLNSRGRP